MPSLLPGFRHHNGQVLAVIPDLVILDYQVGLSRSILRTGLEEMKPGSITPGNNIQYARRGKGRCCFDLEYAPACNCALYYDRIRKPWNRVFSRIPRGAGYFGTCVNTVNSWADEALHTR